MSNDLREDMAEVNALLDDLERSRFKTSQRMERERFKWTIDHAWTLYAACWWFNSIMTHVAGFASLLHPCHTDGAAAYWMYASGWITGGLMFAPLLVLMAGLRLPGD
jgi:hypothetical protein